MMIYMLVVIKFIYKLFYSILFYKVYITINILLILPFKFEIFKLFFSFVSE